MNLLISLSITAFLIFNPIPEVKATNGIAHSSAKYIEASVYDSQGFDPLVTRLICFGTGLAWELAGDMSLWDIITNTYGVESYFAVKELGKEPAVSANRRISNRPITSHDDGIKKEDMNDTINNIYY